MTKYRRHFVPVSNLRSFSALNTTSLQVRFGFFCEVTCDGEPEGPALRGEDMGKNVDAIDAGVRPSVGVVGGEELEVGRMIDGWPGVVPRREDELEGPALVLRIHRAGDGEVGADEHLEPLLLALGDPGSGGSEGDVWPSE